MHDIILWFALPAYHLFFVDSLEAVNKNRKIILVALYFLIWGEAANVRFLPECLCYIFHNVSPILSQVLLFLFCSFRELHLGIRLVWPIPYVDDHVSLMSMSDMAKCCKHLSCFVNVLLFMFILEYCKNTCCIFAYFWLIKSYW